MVRVSVYCPRPGNLGGEAPCAPGPQPPGGRRAGRGDLLQHRGCALVARNPLTIATATSSTRPSSSSRAGRGPTNRAYRSASAGPTTWSFETEQGRRRSSRSVPFGHGPFPRTFCSKFAKFSSSLFRGPIVRAAGLAHAVTHRHLAALVSDEAISRSRLPGPEVGKGGRIG